MSYPHTDQAFLAVRHAAVTPTFTTHAGSALEQLDHYTTPLTPSPYQRSLLPVKLGHSARRPPCDATTQARGTRNIV